MSTQKKPPHPKPGRQKNDARRDLGTRIRIARDTVRMTQEELEVKSGLSQSLLSRYETGQKIKVEVAHLQAIARATGAPLDWLIGEPGAQGPAPTTNDRQNLEVADGRDSLSDLQGSMLPGLGEFLRREAEDVTPREARELQGVKFKVDEGQVFDHDFWSDILAAIRRQRARARSSGAGGGGNSPDSQS